MSEPRKHDAHRAELNELNNVSKTHQNKPKTTKSGKQKQPSQSFDTRSRINKDLQTPKRRACSRYTGLNNGDSPSDGEVLQDIIWDPTSPTPANTGKGYRNTRVVAISDIVNRIAPKDAKPVGVDSPLLQWIGDSAVPCTPEIPQPRVRKRSSRQSSVEDLVKLARQFDKNMQEDKETSDKLKTVDADCGKCRNPAETKLPRRAEELRSLPSTSQQAEAELHALFDCSTQKVSGRLSQGSSASSCSQDTKGQPGVSTCTAPRRPELLKVADKKSAAAACPAKDDGSSGVSAGNHDEFDEDWDNDDLLNDSFVLAMTQNSELLRDALPETTSGVNARVTANRHPSACEPTGRAHSASRGASLRLQPLCSALQEVCPKPKTTNRSTFKLEPNPNLQVKMAAAKDASKLHVTAVEPSRSQKPDEINVATKPVSSTTAVKSQSNKITCDQKKTTSAVKKASVAEPVKSVKDIPDKDTKSSFDSDDWNDDELYQVCDNIETIANSQPEQASSTNCQEKQATVVNKQQKATAPLAINTACSRNSYTSANRQSACPPARSNSRPGTSCENYQGWNVPLKGANISHMSQSHPGNRVALGTFSQLRGSSGTFQAVGANHSRPHTVTARPPQNSRHSTFKRNLCDSAATSNKAFVAGQMTGKCSAAEIERKKQEALARRRLRMQKPPKP
ncbi:uncharacterized protein etaa1b [Polymixia lowei]